MSGLVRGYTGPMSRDYLRFAHASTFFLMSAAGRLAIAEALRSCRRSYGVAEARRFRAGLLWVGCVYPVNRRRVWERLASV